MTRRVVAFFACSFLTVSASYPAAALETGGTIEAIDRDDALLKLSDGATYRLPDSFDYAAVRPGMEVVVVYDEAA